MKRTLARNASAVPRFKRLLVPVDFAPASVAAIRHAAFLADRFGARVDLIYVEPVAIPADVTQLPIVLEHEKHKKRAAAWLDKLAIQHLPPEMRGRASVTSGSPYREITELAAARATDLIVMPTQGYTGLQHILLGSTAERVVRHASCPVLTLRVHSRAGGKLRHVRRVLVTTDFSSAAEAGLIYGLKYAQKFEAALTVCHVIEPPSYPQFGYAHVAIVERKRRFAAEHEMEKIRKRLGGGVQYHIRTGAAHDEIVTEAVRSKADLIVVASHGRSAFSHIILGSTAERVVRHAACAVLVVPARRRRASRK